MQRPFSMRGSKSGEHVERILSRLNPERDYQYVFDPFVGAGGIALPLVGLYPDAHHVWGDANRGIESFWKMVLSMNGLAELKNAVADVAREFPAPHLSNDDWRAFRSRYNFLKREYTWADEAELDVADWTRPTLAGHFLWLMAHAMNSLYRENRSGDCNTTRTDRPKSVKWEVIEELTKKLPGKVLFKSGSYSDVLLSAAVRTLSSGDRTLIFLDPPYYDKFDMYVRGGFDHEHLALCALHLARSGASVLLTNSEECRALEPYQDPIWDVTYSDVMYTGSAKKSGRRKNTEVILGANL